MELIEVLSFSTPTNPLLVPFITLQLYSKTSYYPSLQ